MKKVRKTTRNLTILLAAISVLIILGGWHQRGYIAFDSGFLLLVFSPVIIGTWYHAEKQEYLRRKAMMK